MSFEYLHVDTEGLQRLFDRIFGPRITRQPSATLPIEFRDVDHLVELIGGGTE